jgi:hypothetical protein
MQNEQMLRVMASCGLTAAVIAAASAVGSFLLFGRKWRLPHQTMAAMGGIAGAGAAAYLGCDLLQVLPHWPPKEIEPRFLYLVLPAAIAIELVAAIPQVPRWTAWCFRLLLAVAAGRVLLDNSRYLVDSDPDLPPWTTAQTLLILGGFAAALLAVWAALAYLMHRSKDRATPLAVAGVCAGSAVTIMLSSYLTGGQIGLPLAFSLAGAAAVFLAIPDPQNRSGLIGIGMVGLFSLLIMGRFFGKLTTSHALILYATPLLCWLPELPGVRRFWPWLRGVLRVVLVLIPVALVTLHAQRTFEEDTKPPERPDKPTSDDYRNFQP